MSLVRTTLAVALGAGTMYLLDPVNGEQRRARAGRRLQGGLSRTLRISTHEPGGGGWSPALRLIVASFGIRVVVRAMRRPGLTGFAAGLGGVGAIARAIANQPLARIVAQAGAERPPALNTAMGAANARTAA